MNAMQRVIVLMAVVLVALTGLIAPWRMVTGGSGMMVARCYAFLLRPPHYTHPVYADASEIQEYQSAQTAVSQGTSYPYYNPQETIAEFEAKHGRIDGPVRDRNWWWRTEEWSAVEPVLDVAQIAVQWVLILLVTGGLVVCFSGRREKRV